MTLQNRHHRGFTLIEIMAVIAIMGIIAALLIVAARGARRKTDIEAAKAGIQFIASKIDAYYNKRGQMPPDVDSNNYTSEMEIYSTLAEWGFAVPPDKQVDPWGNPYIIVLQGEYTEPFPVATGGPGYGAPPFSKMVLMYLPTPAVAEEKALHNGDLTAPYFMDTVNSYQVISAGPDGKLSRERDYADATYGTVNADNLTNWE